MDDKPYRGMWYRVQPNGFGRWKFAVMQQRGGRPVEIGEAAGPELAARKAAMRCIEQRGNSKR